MDQNFDDIRPYYDQEVNQAIKEVLASPEFSLLVNYIFPARDKKELFEEYGRFNSLNDFQSNFTYNGVKVIIERSISQISYDGLEKLDKDVPYLFMSNHRDIVLDPSLIGYLLFTYGYQIPQMAIGNNLLVSPTVSRLFRLNKSFIVQRNESPRQMYAAWKKLSAYIYHVIVERKENLWIAQREGRAKDGDDRTQTGILKMFLMNIGEDYMNIIRQLNIVPVTISYEYDPCDFLKALELYHSTNNLEFIKDDKFNLNSMLTGLQGSKGRVHITFGEPVSEFLHKHPDHEHQSDWVKYLAEMIDMEIHLNYHLWPSNYIAHDLLTNTLTYADKYTEAEKSFFLERMDRQLGKEGALKNELKRFLLTNYATCVKNNKIALESNAEPSN